MSSRTDGPGSGIDGACGEDCMQALEQLEAYLDGELPDMDLAQVRRHLNACYPCTDRATFEEQLRSIVRRDCVDEAPPTLIARIEQALSEGGQTG